MIVEKTGHYDVTYTKENGEIVNRKIIALTEIPRNLTVLDVTDLNPLQVALLQNKCKEYQEYVNQQIERLFSFENWYSHTVGSDLDTKTLKYRKLTIERIQKFTENHEFITSLKEQYGRIAE